MVASSFAFGDRVAFRGNHSWQGYVGRIVRAGDDELLEHLQAWFPELAGRVDEDPFWLVEVDPAPLDHRRHRLVPGLEVGAFESELLALCECGDPGDCAAECA